MAKMMQKTCSKCGREYYAKPDRRFVCPDCEAARCAEAYKRRKEGRPPKSRECTMCGADAGSDLYRLAITRLVRGDNLLAAKSRVLCRKCAAELAGRFFDSELTR